MSERIWMIGAGDHARVLADLMARSGQALAGFIDPQAKGDLSRFRGVPVFETDSNLDPNRDRLVIGLGSISPETVERRARLFNEYRTRGFRFAVLRDPLAMIANEVSLAEGAQIAMGACLQVGVKVGANSIVNTRASVDHDTTIGDHCHLAPGVTISGGVSIGPRVHIGTGASVVQGLKIGEGAFIAAGAVVVRDVVPGAKVRGVPGGDYV